MGDDPLPVALMNTIWADRDGMHDALTEPADLARWLDAVTGRPATPGGADRAKVAPRDVRQFRQVRDALRRLAAIATGDERMAGASAIADLETAVAVVNRASAKAPMWSELVWPEGGEPQRAAGSRRSPADAALGEIAQQAVDLFAGPDRLALRACHGPGCVLYFVRNHPRREWCSGGCGNRARVARHYRRHRAAGTE